VVNSGAEASERLLESGSHRADRCQGGQRISQGSTDWTVGALVGWPRQRHAGKKGRLASGRRRLSARRRRSSAERRRRNDGQRPRQGPYCD
jgi:hypothetical protein